MGQGKATTLNNKQRARIAGFVSGFAQVVLALSVAVPLFANAHVTVWRTIVGRILTAGLLGWAVWFERNGGT